MTNTEYLALINAAQAAQSGSEFLARYELDYDSFDLIDIYDATHRTIKEIAALAGMSVRQLALHFAIPRRTVENWSMQKHPAAVHELLLIQEALGLLRIKRG